MKGNLPMTRHEKRFGISSFIYCSRRPFHPGRLDELFLEPFFVIPDFDEDVSKPKRSVMEKERILRELQLEASEKQKKRKQMLGDLLRSKGFIWVATSHRQVSYQNPRLLCVIRCHYLQCDGWVAAGG